jgi:hypothetical protein
MKPTSGAAPRPDGSGSQSGDGRHTAVRGLLAVAGGVGVLAGAAQTLYGTRIPDWTGAKAEPVSLGLLTIAMSVFMLACAWGWRNPDQLLLPLAAAVPALVGFTTVGRLWYLPGPLAIAAAVLGVRNWRSAGARAAQAWPRLLTAGLGGCDLLLAADAPPALAVLATASGVALLAAAVLSSHHPRWVAALLAAGSIPFAVAAWAAIVPILILVLTATLAPAVIAGPPPIHTHDHGTA